MSKEYLEALKELKHWKETNNENGAVWLPLFAVEDIEKALLELKAIKESNPSEALKCVNDIYRNAVFVKKEVELKSFTTHHKLFGESPETSKTISEQCTTIKQALLRMQELERVIGIINEKCVGIFQLTCCKNVDEYNDLKFVDYEKLTKEEFWLLKIYVGRI